MLIYLNVIIGIKQNLPIKTFIQEKEMFTSVKNLRNDVNNLYDSRLENNEVEIFDLMLLRDFSKF
jgi:hypothetical protein